MQRSTKQLKICFAWTTLYTVQFLILPRIFPLFFIQGTVFVNISNEASFMYWFSTLFTTVFCAKVISINLLDWMLGDIAYLVLTCIYSANGAYGIGLDSCSSISSVLFEIFINAVVMFMYQGIILAVFSMVRWHRQKHS